MGQDGRRPEGPGSAPGLTCLVPELGAGELHLGGDQLAQVLAQSPEQFAQRQVIIDRPAVGAFRIATVGAHQPGPRSASLPATVPAMPPAVMGASSLPAVPNPALVPPLMRTGAPLPDCPFDCPWDPSETAECAACWRRCVSLLRHHPGQAEASADGQAKELDRMLPAEIGGPSHHTLWTLVVEHAGDPVRALGQAPGEVADHSAAVD